MKQMKQTGFSLVEVLVAMFVGAIGVLAFAALQLTALDLGQETSERAVASSLASELTERMQSSAEDLGAQTVYRDPSVWGTGALNPYTIRPEDCLDVTKPCSGAQMALFDVGELRFLAQNQLPNGDIKVDLCGDSGTEFNCITVAWNEGDINACNIDASSEDMGVKDCYKAQVFFWEL